MSDSTPDAAAVALARRLGVDIPAAAHYRTSTGTAAEEPFETPLVAVFDRFAPRGGGGEEGAGGGGGGGGGAVREKYFMPPLAPSASAAADAAAIGAWLCGVAEGRVDIYISNPVHPFGKLPAAVAPDGTAIFESGAILLYLADAAGATPTPGARANASKWVIWANSSFWPDVERSRRAPPEALVNLEALLAARPFLLGDAFSVADVAVGSYLFYAKAFFGEKYAAAPAVARYLAAIEARPAFKSTIGAE